MRLTLYNCPNSNQRFCVRGEWDWLPCPVVSPQEGHLSATQPGEAGLDALPRRSRAGWCQGCCSSSLSRTGRWSSAAKTKSSSSPQHNFLLLCHPSVQNYTDRQPSFTAVQGGLEGGFPVTGDGWSPEHPGVQEMWLSLKPTGTERFSNGFLVCGAFAQCLGTVSGALPPPSRQAGPGSLHRITKESQSWLMETGLQRLP